MSNTIDSTVADEFMAEAPTAGLESERAAIIAAIENGNLSPNPIRAPRAHSGIRYNSVTGVVDTTDVVRSGAGGTVEGVDGNTDSTASDEETLVDADTGRMREDLSNLMKQVRELTDAADAVVYDRETGEPTLRMSEREREAASSRIRTLMESALYQSDRLSAAEEVQSRARAKQVLIDENEAAINAYSAGDPKRAALLREEIAREEARTVARVLVARRIGG